LCKHFLLSFQIRQDIRNRKYKNVGTVSTTSENFNLWEPFLLNMYGSLCQYYSPGGNFGQDVPSQEKGVLCDVGSSHSENYIFTSPVISVGDPDPQGLASFCRILIRSILRGNESGSNSDYYCGPFDLI
jgi:hypothetical protein